MDEMELIKAEQQFTGFDHLYKGDAKELAAMLIEANETIKSLREQVRRLKLGLTK